MIELEGLTKDFGSLRAVDGISLTIPRGEFFAVLGPNAAGKTTTIKMMVGLIRPTSGRARIAGFDIQQDPLEARARLSYVPDFPFLYEKLTPAEFLRFTGRLFRMPEARIREGCDELVPRFNLEEWLDQPIESLSHGTRQRIAIASALLHRPEVFIIDEPMVGLDPHHARVVKDILRERAREGMSVFLSTHQVSVAEEMADRIGVFHRGRVIACGSADELRSQSQTSGTLEAAFLALTRTEAT
jgi:ABC-2 type transport system ATP-binding protein